MKVGFFSPLPPARTGVADYAAALIRAMRRGGEVLENQPGDINLYHLGNNPLHAEIYDRALTEPGVVVLHDAVLNHFFLGKFANEVYDAYVTEFRYNYGAWAEELGRRLWEGRARSGADPLYFAYPMLRRVAERSRGVIVHNRHAATLATSHGAQNVVCIPHLHEAPIPAFDDDMRALRGRYGVANDGLLIGVFGHLRESKRLSTVLRAFTAMRAAHRNATLLVSGEFASRDLERAVAGACSASGVIRTGYLDDSAFALHAAATDVCVNLRWPSAGETSGIGVRLMGLGRCVIMTAGDEITDLPEDAVMRVDSGPAEEDMLTAYLLWLAEKPSRAREIGTRAAAHIAAHHTVDRVAVEYWHVLNDCYHRVNSAVT